MTHLFRRPGVQENLPLLLVLAVIFTSGCGRQADQNRQPPPVPVQVATVEQQSLPVTLRTIGTVQTLRTVAVKSQVDGIIKSVHFNEGDEVKAGDLLVTLDRRPFENSLQAALSDLASARAQATRAASEAERYQRLDQASVVSKEQFVQLQTQAEMTKAQAAAKEAAVANVQLQLDYTEIRAPIDGRTGQLNLHEGALVKANDATFSLVTINQMAPIGVSFAVPERSLDAVRAALASGGITVRVTGRDSATLQVEGVVDFIDNTVDPTTGMLTLKARFANADPTLWPGRFVNVEIRLGRGVNELVVPTQAVQTGQKGKLIYVVKPDHTVELRTVTVGNSTGDLTAISSGVSANETVVTDGLLRLTPGDRVEVRTLDEAARAPAAATRKK